MTKDQSWKQQRIRALIKETGLDLPLRDRLLDRDVQRVLIRSFNARDERVTAALFQIFTYQWVLDDLDVQQIFQETGAIESVVAVYLQSKKLVTVTACLELLSLMPHQGAVPKALSNMMSSNLLIRLLAIEALRQVPGDVDIPQDQAVKLMDERVNEPVNFYV